MKWLKVGAVVLNQTPLDWEGNSLNILSMLQEARAKNVGILCLPELCITGYGCEDAFHSANTLENAWRVLESLVPETQGLIVSFGIPVLFQNGVFNCACVVVDGKIQGFVAKQFLAGDGLHYEPRWFKPWPSGVRAELQVNGQSYPIGDLLFDVGGIRFGFEICEDAWVATRPGSLHARAGVDLILNPSASHFAFGKLEVRRRFVLEGSRAFGVTYLYANLLGNEAGRAIYDGGALIASNGKLLAVGPRFSFLKAHMTTAVVELERTRMTQARTASFRPDIGNSSDRWILLPFTVSWALEQENSEPTAAWEKSTELKEEEFSRAQALALFDYLRKSRARGFVVSLSGGADSSAVCCHIVHMVQMACAELGSQDFNERLWYLPELREARTLADRVRILLSTAYQSSRNSSDVTRNAAHCLAEAIGTTHYELDISGMVEGYVGLIEQKLGRTLTWEQDDIALQNIQARVRAPSIWMLANIKGALLLATSNRSEAAVGYATMDGDTAGGLSPMAGIDKAFLRHWLRWLELKGPDGFGAMPVLSVVNAQQPTAELRPQSSTQTDEADLMPYSVLDFVERCAIRDKRAPLESYQLARREFPMFGARQMLIWVERFFRLWCRNQWKRERYAPSFHLDDENLDPKTWCRFPILSGGFEWELRQLRAWVEQYERET